MSEEKSKAKDRAKAKADIVRVKLVRRDALGNVLEERVIETKDGDHR